MPLPSSSSPPVNIAKARDVRVYIAFQTAERPPAGRLGSHVHYGFEPGVAPHRPSRPRRGPGIRPLHDP